MRTKRQERQEQRPRPSVDVLLLNSRGANHPWMKQAVASVHAQSYACGLLIHDNNDRALSIGAAYNELVAASTADLVVFLNDDDWMEPDLVAGMEACLHIAAEQNAGTVVHLTTFTTLVVEHTKTMHQARLPHLGMFRRQFLVEHPFNEALERNVHADMFQRLGQAGQFLGKPLSASVVHHYGYMYRQHIGQASGMKVEQR